MNYYIAIHDESRPKWAKGIFVKKSDPMTYHVAALRDRMDVSEIEPEWGEYAAITENTLSLIEKSEMTVEIDDVIEHFVRNQIEELQPLFVDELKDTVRSDRICATTNLSYQNDSLCSGSRAVFELDEFSSDRSPEQLMRTIVEVYADGEMVSGRGRQVATLDQGFM